jgi:hypothetical protein
LQDTTTHTNHSEPSVYNLEPGTEDEYCNLDKVGNIKLGVSEFKKPKTRINKSKKSDLPMVVKQIQKSKPTKQGPKRGGTMTISKVKQLIVIKRFGALG